MKLQELVYNCLNWGSHYLKWKPDLDMKSLSYEFESPIFLHLLWGCNLLIMWWLDQTLASTIPRWVPHSHILINTHKFSTHVGVMSAMDEVHISSSVLYKFLLSPVFLPSRHGVGMYTYRPYLGLESATPSLKSKSWN